MERSRFKGVKSLVTFVRLPSHVSVVELILPYTVDEFDPIQSVIVKFVINHTTIGAICIDNIVATHTVDVGSIP